VVVPTILVLLEDVGEDCLKSWLTVVTMLEMYETSNGWPLCGIGNSGMIFNYSTFRIKDFL
jgi:hypothetical protein